MKNTVMAPTTRTTRTPALLALGAVGALVLASCGDSPSGEATAETAQAQAPAAQAPAAEVPAALPLEQPAVDEHAGHNHAPGAHGQPATAEVADGSELLNNTRSKDKPRLDLDANEHDFGTAIEGERLTHTFKLSSTGGADLVINTAKPTCGCTVAKVAVVKDDGSTETYVMGEPLPPGTELELTARLDTKNKHNVASSKINIFCNDPRQTVTLGLKARVDTYFQIQPGSLAFGEMSVTEEAEQSLVVSGKKPGPFMLSTEGRTTPPGMTVDLIPENPDAEGRSERWTVNVKLGPGCREGNLGYPIQLRSDEEVAGAQALKGGDKPTYSATAMVTARILGPISWNPQYLSFGLVRPGQVVQRTFEVSSFGDDFTFENPVIRIVGPNDQKPDFEWVENFSATTRPSEDGKSMVVELTLTGLPEEASGSFQGRLILETGHEAKPEIPVLFSGVCRPGVRTSQAGVPAAGGGGN